MKNILGPTGYQVLPHNRLFDTVKQGITHLLCESLTRLSLFVQDCFSPDFTIILFFVIVAQHRSNEKGFLDGRVDTCQKRGRLNPLSSRVRILGVLGNDS
jgi:hypothetical protein